MEHLLLDNSELARMLSLSQRTVRRRKARGLPQVLLGKRVLFHPIAVKEWLVEGNADPHPVAGTMRRKPGRPRRVVG